MERGGEGVDGVYLLYLDESGNPDDAGDLFFVLAGAAVFERTTYFVSQDLDKVQATRFPGQQPVEFHVAQLREYS